MLAVYSFGKDARACGLAHAARPAKQISMRQLLILDGGLKSVSKSILTHYSRKTRRAILPRRNNIILAHDMPVFVIVHKDNTFTAIFRHPTTFFEKMMRGGNV